MNLKTVQWLIGAVLLTIWCSAWTGSNTQCMINYLEFESNIAHLDLPSCPEGIEMDPSEGFCRLGLVGDKAFLYTFKLIDKSMCMTDAQEVPLSNFLSK